MIKAIIFDIGGVVTFTDFHKLYTNFANRVGINPEFVIQYHPNSWDKLLVGDITLDGFFQDMKDAGAKDSLDLKIIWLEETLKVRAVNEELLNVITKLRKNYKVGVLTNLSPSRLMVDQHMGIYDHFDFAILSCIEHLKKPDPKFYQLALSKANATASECIFIDDKESNIIAARELGFKDIAYTTNELLFEELKKLGIVF